MMDDADPHEEISRLEERIEALADSIERCRKISLLSRIAIAIGAGWILLMLFAVISLAAFNIVGAIAAVLGGIVLLGSNASTWSQTQTALAAAEARRHELIGTIELQTVKGRRQNGSGHLLTS